MKQVTKPSIGYRAPSIPKEDEVNKSRLN